LARGDFVEQQEKSVFGLFFEVKPKPNFRQAYFDQVDRLKPDLAKHEGLLWLQRYESLTVPGLLLSHQYWADEQALSAWRQNSNHLLSQQEGINSIFEDYRIRVGPRLWHWDCDASSTVAWLDHDASAPYILTLQCDASSDIAELAAGLDITGHFVSLNCAQNHFFIATCPDFLAALRQSIMISGVRKAGLFAPSRDYGMFDRIEAPRHNKTELPKVTLRI
jgi:heme-degrading monooxygenase HmoA